MNRHRFVIRQLLILVFCVAFFSCNSTPKSEFSNPRIKAGIAKISGKIVDYNPKETDEKASFLFNVPHPFTLGSKLTNIDVNDDGSFSAEIPIETAPAFGFLWTNFGCQSFLVCLDADQETKIEIVTGTDDERIMKVLSGPDFMPDDFKYWSDLIVSMSQLGPEKSQHLTKDSIDHFISKPSDYIPYALKYDLGKRLKKAKIDKNISDTSRNILLNEFNMIYLPSLFNFPDHMLDIYEDIRRDGDTTTLATPPEPDRSYYSFLKQFDLNNPQYLYSSEYARLYQAILKKTTLNVPPIGDIPIDEWLKGAKVALADLVGFDSGLFYDVLISNAYSRQFIEEMKPLTDKQKENLKNYYKDGEVAKILLRENEDVAKRTRDKGETVINPTPAVAKEKLMQAIVSKHKGKPVVVDFWATWCGPCLRAMREMYDVKNEFKKEVVFVYIASESSPEETWRENTKVIDGEHYYLNEDEWGHLFDEFKFEGIPTYLFFDTDGVFKSKEIGYPGNDKMRTMLNDLLP